MTLLDARGRALLRQLMTGEKPRLTQAERVIAKFGGARKLAKALALDPSTVYKWTYPREKQGTGGVVPNNKIPALLAAARAEGILFTPAELWPGETAGVPRCDSV